MAHWALARSCWEIFLSRNSKTVRPKKASVSWTIANIPVWISCPTIPSTFSAFQVWPANDWKVLWLKQLCVASSFSPSAWKFLVRQGQRTCDLCQTTIQNYSSDLCRNKHLTYRCLFVRIIVWVLLERHSFKSGSPTPKAQGIAWESFVCVHMLQLSTRPFLHLCSSACGHVWTLQPRLRA